MLMLRSLALAGLITLTAISPAQDEKPQKEKVPPIPNEAVMAVKLKRTQSILEALTREDYKSLQENAEALVRICDSTAFMRAYKTEEYEFQAQVFKRAAATLAAKAEKKNLDGATLAYTELTLSCVNCHNSFRVLKKKD